VLSPKRPSHCVAIAVLLALSVLIWHAETMAGQLTQSWVDNSASATGISVERSQGSTGTFTEIATTSGAATSYTDTLLADGTTYCYRVRAFTATAYSGYSNTACGTTAQAIALSVALAGTGSGVVISTQAGILCGTTCSATYGSGTVVTLTATPATGSTFAGWSGSSCTGTTSTCTATVTAPTTVTATFTATPAPAPVGLTVTPAGTGSGTVSSSPAGITCGTTCSTTYSSGTGVTLTATPATGSTFAGWSGGGCTGTGTCTVTVTAPTTVTATFTASPMAPTPPPPAPTVNLVVSGGPSSGHPYSVEAQTNVTGAVTVNFYVGGVLYRQESVYKYCLFGGNSICAVGKLGAGAHTVRADVVSGGVVVATAQITVTEPQPTLPASHRPGPWRR